MNTMHFTLAVGTKKLAPKWIGPYEITEVINEVAMRVALPKKWKMHNVFHVSLLKPYEQPNAYQK